MILSLLTLSALPQIPTARELAWEFHKTQMSGEQTIQKWESTPQNLRPVFLDAASRALDSTDFQNLILHIGLNQELDLEESLGQVVFRTKLKQGWLPKAENKKHLRWLRIEL